MTESESVALPLGDAALTERIIADVGAFVKREKQKTRAGAYGASLRRFLTRAQKPAVLFLARVYNSEENS